jgi:histidinol-phosphatase
MTCRKAGLRTLELEHGGSGRIAFPSLAAQWLLMRLGSITVAGAVLAFHQLPVTLRRANSSGIRGELTAPETLTQALAAMSSAEYSPELGAALDAARAAAEVIRGFYQRNVKIEVKADKTPVTEADVRSEEAIRELLTRRFPTYGFYGEETGKSDMDAESVWLVDPIDGTKSFVRDCPFFSTQIALLRGGRFVLGVSCAPAYGELAWAERGGGAFLDGKRIRVSAVTGVDSAIVSTGNLKTLAASPAWSRLGALIGGINRIRGYGDFVHYHLLARGALDVVIESDVNILDIAALTVIVEEAGGTFTDLTGAPVGLATTSVLATNAALHAPVLERLRF